ncbi:class I SAM-dependent methyltransferase [Mariniblastus fucicola]|uniref:Ubiquinone/menaquinone biosynthesis C-methyltransferase UbiE n=1 Tax=Mariniblastus fucicola TaxID=980251 RepID=A0A5B9PH25_9BACT|nr:methyltransferase domain-containing protein [Mariniblastus fucicola]QEG24909.1 Ubiquinone/menaquinone biosynthesis C-methyltransferase UbiE [Mariniblastus fucicola]
MQTNTMRLAMLLILAFPIGLCAQTETANETEQKSSSSESSSMGGEKSVKPGVNKNFVDPNLDVDSYVKRFEIESREVYLTRERILAACDIEKGDSVADVGAGTGLFSRMFSTMVGDEGWVYSVDISPRFLEHINRESAKHQISNITGVLCAENSVSLPPNSVDVVFICDTYHHFEYPQSTLASIKRALKPGGHMIVIDFERIEGVSRDWTMGHVRAGKEVFQAEILDAGFKLAEEKKIDGFQENYFLKFTKE